MILIYTPDDGPPQEYEFQPGLLMDPEAEAIEAVGDYAWDSYEQFGALFFKGNMRAKRVALWIMMKRKNPRLRLDEVHCRANQLDVDYSARERQMLLSAMLQDPDLDPEQKENLEAALKEDPVPDAEQAMADAGRPREPDPKDLSPNSGSVSGPYVPKGFRPDSES